MPSNNSKKDVHAKQTAPRRRKDSFPPPPPKQRARPYPEGTLVTGYTQTGLFGFPGHRDHGQFLLESPPRKADPSNSGFHQDISCVSCGTEIVNVDCEFLMVKATKEQVLQSMHKITQARNHLLKARKFYNLMIEQGKVK